jgi:two-component system, cell cycle sensor histidine kinase and response regulator CckA
MNGHAQVPRDASCSSRRCSFAVQLLCTSLFTVFLAWNPWGWGSNTVRANQEKLSSLCIEIGRFDGTVVKGEASPAPSEGVEEAQRGVAPRNAGGPERLENTGSRPRFIPYSILARNDENDDIAHLSAPPSVRESESTGTPVGGPLTGRGLIWLLGSIGLMVQTPPPKRPFKKRKQAKDLQTGSGGFITTILEALPHPFSVIDAENCTVSLANSAARMSEPAADGARSWGCGGDTPSMQSEDFELVEEVRRTGRPAVIEQARCTNDGHKTYHEVHGYPVFDSSQRLTHIVKCSLDITRHRKAEEKLRQSEEKHKEILAGIEEGYYESDLEGNILMANDSLSAILGYSAKEINEIGYRGLFPEHEWRNVKNVFETVFQTAKPSMISSAEILRKDGAMAYLDISVALVKKPFGSEQVSGFRGIVRDVTHRRCTEEAIQREWSRLSSMLDGNPIPTFVIDRGHRVVLWNRACETLTGISKENVLGDEIDSTVFHSGPRKPTLADVVLESDEPAMEKWFGKKNLARSSTVPDAYEASDLMIMKGVKRYLYSIAARLKDPKGRLIGAIETLQDMTEREELQRQLQHAQKMEAVGTLAAGMAHEFNNILMGIQGYAQLVCTNGDTKDSHVHYMQQILMSCGRAAGLIKKMLIFARPDTGERQPTHVNTIVNSVLQILRQTIPPQIELKSDLAGDLPHVMAVPSQMEQVLMNLGVNGRDAMPDGGALTFRTKLTELDKEFVSNHTWAKMGTYVEISVEDNGSGIREEYIEHVFDPFFTTKEPGKGTGLGLSIVYSIVKNHKGHILAESEPGNGSCFRVFLEVEKTPTADYRDPKSITSLPAASREEKIVEAQQGRGERVLVVDDEEQVREVAEGILNTFGYQTVPASNGREAVEVYRKALEEGSPFSLVILDKAMPVMDGDACLLALMELDPEVRVLFTTGYADEPMRKHAIASGAKGFLHKPFDLENLLGAVKKVLDPR